ncbi:DUF2493 domain-containing protein [Candidatus Aerophobetes bacterium]|uniref:DUF2493 domain-containing protein n=1 Tax=Aerophobetes bacterium TaxID=2030807 RepID=A0A523QM65_UNCAE|nr:MAG: DUF2493 domain-containing protein [Candidatus Aerophobetes bacterium]
MGAVSDLKPKKDNHRMTVCHAVGCKNHNRHNPPGCKLEGGAVIGVRVLCTLFKMDYEYERAQGRKRLDIRPWTKANAGKVTPGNIRVLICGSRNWTDEETIEDYIKTLPPQSVIIHGNCKGADKIAQRLALKHGHSEIPFKAKWGKNGRKAGPIRNREMLDKGDPDFVVAFNDDIQSSKGTKDMIRLTLSRGIPYEVKISYDAKCMAFFSYLMEAEE